MRTVLLALLLSSGSWQLAPTAAAVRPMQGGRDTLGYRVEDVRYRSDQLTLAADLLLPARSIRVPGAVIIQGSGTSDRTNRWARDIAEALVHRGVAVLLTDKRGSGASEGDWRTANFNDLASDALAGVQLLRKHPEIDPNRVGLVGLSQGGWVAPLAAARTDEVAFVIDISGATVTFAEQTFSEMANTARRAGLKEDQVQEVLDLNRTAAEYLTTGNWERYEGARARGLQSEWRQVAEGFPESPDLPIWTFLRSVANYNPLPYWLQLTEPILVLYGELDEQDNVPVQESVRRLEFAFRSVGKRNYQIVVIPGVGHSLRDPRSRALAPAFLEAISRWGEQFVWLSSPP